MKILVSCVPFDRGESGISVYTREIIEELKRQQHELILLVESDATVFFPDYTVIALPRWTKRPLFSMIYHLFIAPFIIKKYRCDFFIIAAGNRRSFMFYPRFTITVVHDLAQFHIVQKYDSFRMFYLKKILPIFVRRAPAVVAISKSTARDLEKFWRVAPDRIHLNYNGLTIPTNQRSGWLKQHNLTGENYILYLSRIHHPGKNHLNLMCAFEMLPSEVRGNLKLVFGGSDWDGAEEVHQYAEQSACAEQIIFTGFIDSADLEEAYRNAQIYVFPSLFEGFGLSLIEAMYYGVPCCCSNSSSLGEIGHDAALLFNPEKPNEIAAAMEKILTDDKLREELIAAGHNRAVEFSWKKHVKKLVEIYENSRS